MRQVTAPDVVLGVLVLLLLPTLYGVVELLVVVVAAAAEEIERTGGCTSTFGALTPFS